MGVVEASTPVADNEWEDVKKGGDAAVRSWIVDQLSGTSAALVLIGSRTARRKWIHHEIREAWREKKGLLGVYIHNLQDSDGDQSKKGRNPFDDFTVDGVTMSEIVKAYNPPYSKSTEAYAHIEENLQGWIEEAIGIRRDYH